MHQPANIALGPFDLEREIARGGMGIVYRATHRAEGVPAAIKVIRQVGVQRAQFYEDFRREVHATAQLTHPGIVTLFDYGVISKDAAAASGGALMAGSPFLVMQLLESGTLAHHAPGDYRTLRTLLLQLLDALAHAHAHGLVHRDLKPPNVLFGGSEGRLKLVDFGIAHASDRRSEDSDLHRIPGTRAYMAPEQVECRWREYGPWTDLYALGIMTFELSAGRRPFVSDEQVALMLMHLDKELPPLTPSFEVPDGFPEWVDRLCRKRPIERYQCAADAAAALIALGDVEGSPREADAAPLAHEALPTIVSGEMPAFELRAADRSAGEAFRGAAPIASDWRRPDPKTTTTLRGAGLGLYFLRAVPLVGRETERDAMWSALSTCASENKPKIIALRGPSGTGKSRLASWLCLRAHEMGAARILKATHDPSAGPAHGLARMLALHYRCVGLRDDDLLEHLSGALRNEGSTDPLECRAAAALMDAQESASSRSSSFAGPAERYSAIEAVLVRAARERPVIVWLDDVQWGTDALGLVEHALESIDAPILFVLTVRDEALSERPVETRQLGRIERDDRAHAISIGPLAEHETAMLISSLLGLSGSLAQSLCTRVGGNPLFAVQLIGDWVQRGVLHLTSEGFVLAPGERGEIPKDIHTVWSDRIERVLRDRPPTDRVVLELAATLGSSVDSDELAAACELLGHSMSPDLFEALTRASLCAHTESGWAFVHTMMRESLLASAKAAGRTEALHGICARMLKGRSGRGVAGRLAYHYAEAGELEAALEPLCAAAKELRDESDFGPSRAALERREELLARLALPPHDIRWGIGWVLRADVHRFEWDFEGARTWAEKALAAAEQHGWHAVRARALAVLAHCARQQGDMPLAEQRSRVALSLFVELGDDDGHVRTLLAMAVAARQLGELTRAEEIYARAYAYFEMLGDERGAANAMLGLAHVARHRQHYQEAEEKYARARARFERAGYRAGVADCLMGSGDLARFRCNLEEAYAAYHEANRLQVAIRSKQAFISRLNLALVLLGQRRFGEARRALEAELPGLEREAKRAYLSFVHTVILACVTAEGDLAAFDAHMARATQLDDTRALVDEDMAACAEQAGRWLHAQGDLRRARAALSLALAQWEALGDKERASEIRALLEHC